jgi:hypothetical protein
MSFDGSLPIFWDDRVMKCISPVLGPLVIANLAIGYL